MSYLSETEGKITRRDIARAFNIKGDDRTRLRSLLNEMSADGDLPKVQGKTVAQGEVLPKVCVIKVHHISDSGALYGHSETWSGDGNGPQIRIIEERQRKPRKNIAALGIGDRVLARLESRNQKHRARIIKRLPKKDIEAILGVFHLEDGQGPAGWIEPVDKKARLVFMVSANNVGDAQDGELVRALPLPHHRHQFGPPQAKVVEALGDILSPRSISLIAVHQHGIPVSFPAEALAEAKAAKAPLLDKRVDLRGIPLITIDPHDARDHDDAIWAEKDKNPDNLDGWHVIVAIADVAHYVKSGSALDKSARERGNSCYFPDRVVPMLPEELSTHLCSLKAGQDRASLVAHLYLSDKGRLKSHRFERALIRCAANLSYQEVQAAVDGRPNERTEPFLKDVLEPLYGAFDAIHKARLKRGPLELDLPERKVLLDDEGMVSAVKLRERLNAHRLVEDFMIAANVAAAESLERQRTPLLYRVHEEPSQEKIEALREYLDGFEIRLAKGQVTRPAIFNRVLERAKDTPYADGVSDMVLRSQMQAYYGPENLGHFGLALGRYTHFTSPIRRYADLVIHRALIAAHKLGDDGLQDHELTHLSETAEHISKTERRAMLAERDSLDRYLAAYYARHRGDVFKGRISGVTRFGLFVKVQPAGGDGFVPAAQMGPDYFHHDEKRQALIGEVTGDAFQLGDTIDVKIKDAELVTGSLRLEIMSDAPHKMKFKKSKASKSPRQFKRNRKGRR